jgi:hypothetical protein
VRPDLDHWLPDPAIRVHHRREAAVPQAELWDAARSVRVSDTRVLGRVLRWRIPGTPDGIAYDELFREPPFTVLHEDEGALVSGLVGRIWTLRRDYPAIAGPEEFRAWSTPGTARVVYANWVEPAGPHRAMLVSETRVAATDRDSRIGLAAVRPLVAAFHPLIAREALVIATRRAEQRSPPAS